MEPGFELELDNRKLIIAFAILILVIGCFFVWGYMVGKRQGMQLASTGASDSAPGSITDGTFSQGADTGSSVSEASSPGAEEVQQNLEWYQSVNKKRFHYGSDKVLWRRFCKKR